MSNQLNSCHSKNLLNMSEHVQTCLNLFRFNMVHIVMIHDSCDSQSCLNLLKHVKTCSDSIWYELLQFIWSSNMSEHVQTCLNLIRFNMIWIRVSNGTGQCNFSGRRERNSFIVPGQRDNRTSYKSCQGTGRAGTAKIRNGYWPAQPKSGTGHGTKRDKAEKDILKQKTLF